MEVFSQLRFPQVDIKLVVQVAYSRDIYGGGVIGSVCTKLPVMKRAGTGRILMKSTGENVSFMIGFPPKDIPSLRDFPK